MVVEAKLNRGSSKLHRFSPTRESLGYMKVFRDRLSAIQDQIPQVKGFGFFGSRTIGRERNDASRLSDLDIVVFYDGSVFEVDESSFTISGSDGELLPDARKRVQELVGKRQTADNACTAMHVKSKQMTTALMRELGLPINIADESGQNKTIFTVDISRGATDRSLELLKMYMDVDSILNPETQHVHPDGINGVTFPLVSRFLLGIGEDLYKNRTYVLNSLEHMKQGEQYFQGMMDCLRGMQRIEDQQGKLPQTITEAKSYFRVR